MLIETPAAPRDSACETRTQRDSFLGTRHDTTWHQGNRHTNYRTRLVTWPCDWEHLRQSMHAHMHASAQERHTHAVELQNHAFPRLRRQALRSNKCMSTDCCAMARNKGLTQAKHSHPSFSTNFRQSSLISAPSVHPISAGRGWIGQNARETGKQYGPSPLLLFHLGAEAGESQASVR